MGKRESVKRQLAKGLTDNVLKDLHGEMRNMVKKELNSDKQHKREPVRRKSFWAAYVTGAIAAAVFFALLARG